MTSLTGMMDVAFAFLGKRHVKRIACYTCLRSRPQAHEMMTFHVAQEFQAIQLLFCSK